MRAARDLRKTARISRTQGRRWPSVYAAVEGGGQDSEWLESYFMQQPPASGPLLFSLDGTPWPHPAARALADRQNEYRSALFSAHKPLQRLVPFHDDFAGRSLLGNIPKLVPMWDLNVYQNHLDRALAIIYALATCLDLEGLSRCRHSKRHCKFLKHWLKNQILRRC